MFRRAVTAFRKGLRMPMTPWIERSLRCARMMSFVVAVILVAVPRALAAGSWSQVAVINGRDAGPDEYPFVAAVRRFASDQPYCTGSLIAARWVLTAKHCFPLSYHITDIGITFGNSATVPGRLRYYFIDQVIRHTSADVALIELRNAVSGTPSVVLGELPSRPDGLPVEYAGWGETIWNTPSSRPKIMQAIDLRVNDGCSSDVFICTQARVDSAKVGGNSSGDSGGPLLYRTGGRLIQVGVMITSTSKSLKSTSENIAAIRSWIDQYVH